MEVMSRPMLPLGSDGGGHAQGDAVPQDVSTTVSNPPWAFKQFLRLSNWDNDGSEIGSKSNNTDDNDDNSNALVIIAPASEEEPITFLTTTILYSESFESGLIDVDSTHSSCYFTWSLNSSNSGSSSSRGDETLWKVVALQDGVNVSGLPC